MKQINIKKLLLLNLPYLLIGLFATKLGQAWRLAAGVDASTKLLHLPEGFAAAFQSFLPSFYPQDLVIGLLCGAALRLAVYVKGKNAKKYRKDIEYGSARWGTAEDIKPFVDPVFENNIILTQTEGLMMSNRPKNPKYARNKNVLIIGGGDGGVAKELLQYKSIESIDVVETDRMFVDVCREYFQEVACALDDERVKIHYDDGLRFLRNKKGIYDLIINDSTDPFGHTEGLFTKEFYGSCYNALKDDGIMVYQHGSPFYDEDEAACRSMHRKAFRSFPISRVYQAHIPTCPSGYWLFGFASKKYHPIKDFKPKEWNGLKIETWYYTTHLHMGAFMLPKYVEDLLEEEEQ